MDLLVYFRPFEWAQIIGSVVFGALCVWRWNRWRISLVDDSQEQAQIIERLTRQV